MEFGCDMDDVLEMREAMVCTRNDSCTLVIDMTIHNHWVEAVVDSWTQVSVLSRRLCDSLSCRPKPVKSIRLTGTSASGVMVGCRVDDVEVDLGGGSKRHSLQAVELSLWFQVAVQIVSNLPAPSNGGPIYRFLGMPAMRTRWMAGAAAHKSGVMSRPIQVRQL